MKRLKNKIFVNIFVAMFVTVLVFSFTFFANKNSDKFLQANAENQEATTSFIAGLESSSEIFDTVYSISNEYNIDAENQITTDFCWLFSSLKCLETSYMVQLNEWYNFSETAMAYLNYVENKASGQAAYDSTGNLLTFNNIAKKYGLVLENDVSNDLLLEIDESNFQIYSYISKLASKNFIENAQLISFGVNSYFSNLTYSKQLYVMKNFIKNYGALFIAFGEGDGILFETATIPQYSHTSEGHEYDSTVAIKRHSVCIVGWNEKGFIALNSWGDEEGMFQTFCIPYDLTLSKLDELLPSVRGYVVSQDSQASIETGSNNNLKNIFSFGEKINLTFKINNTYDFNQTKVEVWKGTEDVTYNFVINFDETNSKISFKSKFESTENTSGGYTIRIYVENEQIAIKSFLILSASEVASVSLERYLQLGTYDLENLSLNNSYLSGKHTTTYLINPYGEYRLRLSLSSFSKCKYLDSDPTFSRFKDASGYDALFDISSIKVQKISTSGMSFEDTGLKLTKSVIAYDLNKFEFTLPKFNGDNAVYQNKLLSFDIIVNPTTSNGEKNKLTFLMFIGNTDGVKTSQNYSINYQLDGGKNNEKNITSYPNYQTNSTMTDFVLNSPSKSGYAFLGWYSDSEFKNQVLKISKAFSSDIVLYAKWDTADIEEYILTNIEIASIISAEGNKKTNLQIEYGDNVSFNYNFIPQGELIKYNYDARLIAYYEFLGTKYYLSEINNQQITSQAKLDFNLGYPELVAGTYNLVIEAQIIINSVATVKSSAEYSFVNNKRTVELEMSNLLFEYDGNAHFPKIKTKDGDVFEDDIDDFNLKFSISQQVNAGTYNIKISSLNSNYKISDEQSTCSFEIKKKLLSVQWNNQEIIFNTQNQKPTFELIGVIEGDLVNVSLKEDNFKDAGSYVAKIDVNTITNKNYYILESEYEFEINPAKIEIKFDNISEHLRIAPEYRKQITFEVTGMILNNMSADAKTAIINSLNIVESCEGINATKFGKYVISGTYDNLNYDATIIDGVYNLTAPYKVFYKLPDGTVYEESVEENANPRGINRDIYNYTIFQIPEYSQSLVGDGTENLYITVTIRDYTVYVVVVVIVIAMISIYLFATRKQRRNKVS